MPIHVFRCGACGDKFERLQKLSDPDPDVCPHCGKRHKVQREVSAPAFRLAGRGWYETDFKSNREAKHNLAGEAGKPSAKPDGASTKPDTAPAKPAKVEKPATAATP